MQGLFLLTMKPVTYAANVAEGDLGDQVAMGVPASLFNCRGHWQLLAATLMQMAVLAAGTADGHHLCDSWLQGAQNTHVQALRQKAEQEGRQVVIVSAQVFIGAACRLQAKDTSAVEAMARSSGPRSSGVPVPALFGHVKVESELKDLEPEDAAEYLESLGATEGGLNR